MLNRIVREIAVGAAALAPIHQRQQIRRRARGREDTFNLQHADYAVVSYGKSGRTWLNVMLSRFFQLRFNLPERLLLSFDNMHRKNHQIPTVLFTHDNYIRDYTGDGATKVSFYGKPTILLVRHPADVAVSQFFQWRYRMQPHKKILNDYPSHGSDVSIFDFIMHEKAGLEKVILFMNEWAKELPQLRNCLVVRYEDMRADAKAELGRVLTWMDQKPTEAEIDGAVDFASFDNLKKLEDKRVFRLSGKRMTPGEKGNPDSYKVRRAKVGGYRDYFTDDQVREIDAYIRQHLSPAFGYKLD
jgi:hypothetical protein